MTQEHWIKDTLCLLWAHTQAPLVAIDPVCVSVCECVCVCLLVVIVKNTMRLLSRLQQSQTFDLLKMMSEVGNHSEVLRANVPF